MTRLETVRARPGLVLTALLAWSIGAGCAGAAAAPSAWRDPATGFAIAGYDPVAYYTDAKPVMGSEGVEYNWGGAVWRFVNSGNRDAFAAHPGIYAPVFAGYDPLALSRGLTVQGNPVIWARYGGHIYLFAGIGSLRLWRGDPQTYLSRAETQWPRLGKELPGTSENEVPSPKAPGPRR